jgi:hypothetical protein
MAVGVRIRNVAAAWSNSGGGWRYESCGFSFTAFWCLSVQGYQTGTFRKVYQSTEGWCFQFSRKSRNTLTRGQYVEKLHTMDDRIPQSQDCVIPLDSRKENHLGMSVSLSYWKCAKRNGSWPIQTTNQSRAIIAWRRAAQGVLKDRENPRYEGAIGAKEGPKRIGRFVVHQAANEN